MNAIFNHTYTHLHSLSLSLFFVSSSLSLSFSISLSLFLSLFLSFSFVKLRMWNHCHTYLLVANSHLSSSIHTFKWHSLHKFELNWNAYMNCYYFSYVQHSDSTESTHTHNEDIKRFAVTNFTNEVTMKIWDMLAPWNTINTKTVQKRNPWNHWIKLWKLYSLLWGYFVFSKTWVRIVIPSICTKMTAIKMMNYYRGAMIAVYILQMTFEQTILCDMAFYTKTLTAIVKAPIDQMYATFLFWSFSMIFSEMVN